MENFQDMVYSEVVEICGMIKVNKHVRETNVGNEDVRREV